MRYDFFVRQDEDEPAELIFNGSLEEYKDDPISSQWKGCEIVAEDIVTYEQYWVDENTKTLEAIGTQVIAR